MNFELNQNFKRAFSNKISIVFTFLYDVECGKPSEVLQRADIPLIDNARCQEMITEISSGTTIIHKEQVCAG